MRSTGVAVFLFVCFHLAGCTSSSGIDGLGLSTETTSSIPRPNAAVPAVAAVAALAPTDTGQIGEAVEGVGEAAEATSELRPNALVPTARPAIPAPAKIVALVPPGRPDIAKSGPPPGGIRRHRFRDAKPINFGRASPTQLAVHGVDVSRWQGNIDWETLREQGANFVYIKATDGGDHLDPMFRENWRKAGAAGLRRGAYHFFYWCRVASEQADWFIRNVPKVEGALPPVIDVEWNHLSNCKKRPSRQLVLEKMKVFMDRLERHYGQRPIIYTAPDFYRDNLKGEFLDYPFWLRSVAAHPAKVYPGRKWVFWQYSGSGLSQGVKGRIDLNVFQGSEKEWHAWVRSVAG